MAEPTQTPQTPPAGDQGGAGGAGGTQTPPAPTTPPAVDFSKLGEADLAKVLENENLWKQPRIAELLGHSKELKTLKTQAEQQTETQLAEQKKFEELATKRGDDLAKATQTITSLRQDQALTNLLIKEGVVDLDAALKLADRGKLTIDEATGAVTGADAVIGELKTGKAYLFTQGGGTQSLGTPTNNGTGGTQTPGGTQFKFKRSQLKDSAFYTANREEILKAQAAGLIENDL